MKRYLLFAFYCLVFGIVPTACSSWLDVGSKSEVDETEMFTTREGFYATLTGIYLNLGTTALYGGNLPLLALEPLTQQYLVDADAPDRQQWSQFNYTTDGGQQLVNDIWLTMFNTIVNANMLLSQLDRAPQAGVPAATTDILRGETLALRALMYFDLVRLFDAAVPAADAAAVANATSNVPFKTDFGFQLGDVLTTDSLLERLAADLRTARRLLEADPWVTGQTATDEYTAYDRRQRMNGDACTALLSRLELYRGRYAAADSLARQLLSRRRYRYIRADEVVQTDAYGAELSADRLFVPELIFALYTDNILTTSRSNYEGLTGDFVKTADHYEESDLRRQWLFSNPSALGKINLIRYQRSIRQQDQQRYGDPVVPILKLSEIQLIAAECALQRGDSDEAISQLNTLREARGESLLSLDSSTDDIDAALTHEYQCDFRGEGQLFYYYKRRAFTAIDDGYGKGNTVSVAPSAYTLPLPPYEIQFGHR